MAVVRLGSRGGYRMAPWYKTVLDYPHKVSQKVRPLSLGSSHYGSWYQRKEWVWPVMTVMVGAGGFLVWRRSRDQKSNLFPQIMADEGGKTDKEKSVPRRARRYKDFSSIMYEGQMYMSPRDFLESITQDEPRAHAFQVMDDRILSQSLKAVPQLSKGTSHTFRDLWNNGILSYADYLFLINALVKPRRQFEIVFKMIDADGSSTIELQEFERMQKSVTRRGENNALAEPTNINMSSLIVHLFGPKGNKKLASSDLFHFIDNLQTEVREMEFQKYSLGGPTITPEEFAQILLRHTSYDMQDVFERLKPDGNPNHASQGITFKQYDDFCQLLNALDDFAVAMTMYNIAGKSLSEDEFGRAAKVSIGKSLDKTVVHTVFKIFDVDGDGKLSYKEFLAVMKNWQVRGMKIKQTKSEGIWSEFKTCVKLEMRNQ